MTDEPAAMTPPSNQRRIFTRPVQIVLGSLIIVGVGLYLLSWVNAYRNGSYLVGPSDLEAGIALARHHDPDQAGVVWTKGMVPPDVQFRSHKVDGSWLFGLVQHFREDGPIEVIGTRDGERRCRVTLDSGPFGIGWLEATYQLRPPAPEQ